jgi:hypothetical protein
VRVEHDNLTCSDERSEKHEKILSTLPRQPFSRNRKHVGMQGTKSSELFRESGALDLTSWDQLNPRMRVLCTQFLKRMSWISTEDEKNYLHRVVVET